MLKSKIVHLKEIYNFYFDHFLLKRMVFDLSIKYGFYKIKKIHFPAKLCEIRKNVTKQNCSSQRNLQFLFWLIFDKNAWFFIYPSNTVFTKSKNPFSGQTMQDTKQMLLNKIVHLKEIYNFYFDHFLIKRTVFLLIEKTLLKIIKNCDPRPKNAWYKKMLRSKIVHLQKIYKFYFDHFLVKRTVFVLIGKTLLKIIKNCGFRPNYATYEENVKKQN